MSRRPIEKAQVETWLGHLAKYVMGRLPELKYDPEILDEGESLTLALTVYLTDGVSPAIVRSNFASGLTWMRGITRLPQIGLTVRQKDGALTASYIVDVSARSLSAESKLAYEMELRKILDDSGVIAGFRIPYRAVMNRIIKLKNERRGKTLEKKVLDVLGLDEVRSLDSKVVEKIVSLVFPKGYKVE